MLHHQKPIGPQTCRLANAPHSLAEQRWLESFPTDTVEAMGEYLMIQDWIKRRERRKREAQLVNKSAPYAFEFNPGQLVQFPYSKTTYRVERSGWRRTNDQPGALPGLKRHLKKLLAR